MKRNVTIFGLVLSLILCIQMVLVVQIFYRQVDFESNDFLGYTFQVVMLSVIFFGIRNYRNKELGGTISFGQAFKAGSLTLLLASTIYVIVWLFYYYLFVPDFIDKFIPHVLKNTTPEDLPKRTKQMENYREMYKNPLFVVLLTYAEIVPVGLVVTLVSSLILKKKPKQQIAA